MRMSITKNIGNQWALLTVNDKIGELIQSLESGINNHIKAGHEIVKNGTPYHAARLLEWITADNWNDPPFTLFMKGNSKLPFLSWSTLPGVNCPGAGECLSWCYSFKAWRYAAAYFRQLQNTILERYAPDIIADTLDRVINRGSFAGRRVDLRLYVDGDFPSLKIMGNWFDLLEDRPRISAYGYSKSLPMFHQYVNRYGHIPANYALNGSTGGRYDHILNSLSDYPFYRGSFRAVDIGHKIKPHNMTKEDRREIRKKAGGGKIFICPGPCGDCTSAGHACGSLSNFKGFDIVTPYH